MSKALKVTSITPWGDEHELDFSIGEGMSEELYVVAILKGVINAKSAIKSFEIVEV